MSERDCSVIGRATRWRENGPASVNLLRRRKADLVLQNAHVVTMDTKINFGVDVQNLAIFANIDCVTSRIASAILYQAIGERRFA